MAGFSLANLFDWTAGLKPTATQLQNAFKNNIRASGGPRQSTPPGSPVDEDIWILVLDSTNGVEAMLKYNSSDAGAYKWHHIGGPEVYVFVGADETTTSTSYVDLATVGPSFTIPRGGDWDVWTEADAYNATGGVLMFASPKKGSSATADADAAPIGPNTASPGVAGTKSTRFTSMAASDVIKAQYKTSAGTAHFVNRVARYRPVRLS